MTYKQAIKTLAVVAGLVAGASQTAAVEITITDFTGPQTTEANNGITGVWGKSFGWNGGPRGIAKEDNETEQANKRVGAVVGNAAATSRGQEWDLEGASLKGTSLYLVGGYDFALGLSGGRPGDLFIKVGSASPFLPQPLLPVSVVSGTLTYPNVQGFDYAIHLSSGVVPGTFNATVTDLNASSIFVSDTNPILGSNPWKLAANSPNDGTFTTKVTYTKGLTAAQTAALTGEANFASLLGDTDGPNSGGYDSGIVTSNLHNPLKIDLSFLGGKNFYMSYTMECGNDQLKGFGHIPDSGTSMMLLGGGLSTLCLFGRRFRK